MRIRAVIFDIGGVLEHTPATGWPDRWAARLGIDVSAIEEVAETIWKPGEIGAATLEQIHAETARALELSPETTATLFQDLWHEYLGAPNTELIDYVAALRPRYRTALLSNSFVGAREREQARYGFEDLVDAVVYSHEEGTRKPDPRFYLLACTRLGVTPGEVVFVDDTDDCVDGARAVGMHAVTHVENARTIRVLESCIAAGQRDADNEERGRPRTGPSTTRP